MNHISQREAIRLKRRVRQLEELERNRRNAFNPTWPDGIHLGSHAFSSIDLSIPTVIRTARRCGHTVVATVENNEVRYYALKLEGQK